MRQLNDIENYEHSHLRRFTLPDLPFEFPCYDLSPIAGAFTCWACDVAEIPTNLLRRPERLAILSDGELVRWNEYCFEEDRDMFFVARVLLRRALSLHADVDPAAWQLANQRFGKPAISFPVLNRHLDFNIAHSDGLVLCAVSTTGPIGIDVESTQRTGITPDMLSYTLAADELNSTGTVPSQYLSSVFLQYWTVKEAYAKAVGLGLSLPLSRIVVRFLANGEIRCEIEGDDGPGVSDWTFRQFRLFGRYICSWAHALAAQPPSRLDVTA